MQTSNTRISSFKKLVSPTALREMIPFSSESEKTILDGRDELINILDGKDDRLIIIAGPCSIHNEKAALEYAGKLSAIRKKFNNKLCIVMRVYFEKPRTIDGWKGLIYDPSLNNTYNIDEGIKKAREILLQITKLGLPTATEILDPIIAGYLGQLSSWVAIGARTTESQTHRQMTSGVSAPVGFKNSTNGNIDVAINAIKTASKKHSFIGVDDDGFASIVNTNGNPYGHIVLRGGNGKANYHIEHIEECEQKLKANDLPARIIVDCSHDNSGKNYKKQNRVVRDVISQKKYGNSSIKGIMLESNLFEGKQSIPANIQDLKYGVSVTDACIGWEETEKLIQLMYDEL